ncbi:hypothetical protein [Methylobacterium sp. E-045]|uniref:hypothetical protein n=1 Tax=Methylobacterium sp. E-045 TaxID=2836575 RepID=UPI001FBAE715|nr:hypothetical protein [Methylobacterium sp. E-045]MCJ2130770.1 hypothetical protein [Methylobacterium sp. E-045]
MKILLNWTGRNGALVVIAGVLIGLFIPHLADTARPYLAVAMFAFTFGSFLKFDPSALRKDIENPRAVALIVLWATLGVPLVVIAALSVLRPGPDLSQGLLFWALVPVSPACVAFAAILRLNITVALLATVASTVLSPLSIPYLAALAGGYTLMVDPLASCLHLGLLIGGAILTAVAAKRFAGGFIRANPEATTGIAVSAMFLAGMGSMHGMQAHLIAQPRTALTFIALSYGVLFLAEIVGSCLFWRFGRTAALTAGLLSGTRTITLAWVVLGDTILPLADLFLASSMIAKYTAPGLTKWLLTRFLDTERPVMPVAPAMKHT